MTVNLRQNLPAEPLFVIPPSNRWTTILLFLIAAICTSGYAINNNMEFFTDSKLGDGLEVIPIGNEEALPQSLQAAASRLPNGSFLLANHTDNDITAMVIVWTFKSPSGQTEERRINCDAYFGSPIEPIVAKQSLSLISTDGCLPEKKFDQLSQHRQLGSTFAQSREKGPDSVASVNVDIDSVIFSDGEIRGRDKFKYYEVIALRYDALQSLLSDLKQPASLGESIRDRVGRIRDEKVGAPNKWSRHKGQLAEIVLRSPNPEGTIKFLAAQPALPDFHHFKERN